MSGQIFKIQRYSIHDGPGIRTTVFFQGCPLSCWWCHNPESRPVIARLKGMVVSNSRKTSHSAIQAEQNQKNKLFKAREIDLDSLVKEMEKDSIFFDHSGGGVTCSGGEPLLQHEFLLKFLKKLKEREIHTVVDTSGFAPIRVMSETADTADLILFDLKLINNENHIKYTGVSVKPVHDNLKLLHDKGTDVWLRFPLIPGITGKSENIDKMIDFLLPFKKFRHINILPFHKTGEGKYLNLGMENLMKGIEPPSEKRIEAVKKKFKQKGFSVITGG